MEKREGDDNAGKVVKHHGKNFYVKDYDDDRDRARMAAEVLICYPTWKLIFFDQLLFEILY